MLKKLTAFIIIALLAGSLVACNAGTEGSDPSAASVVKTNYETTEEPAAATAAQSSAAETTAAESSQADAVITTANTTSGGKIDATDLFTKRDLTQTADESGATAYTLSDGQDISITAEGVYVLSGTASDVTVTVDAADDAKVQLVLDGVSVTNTDAPCVYVKNADKVFVTTTASDNSLSVTGAFTADGDTNTDAVIFSKDDLVLNGLGTLRISSTQNGVSCKDDLKITGGTISVNATADAFEANESVAIADGAITINTEKDGIHAENDKDNTTGCVYICGGTLDITAGSDGVQATTVAQIDGGSLTVNASEGIEATYVQLNGGTVSLTASDDGINGSSKSNAFPVTVEINGGDISITMGQGDTDAIDSNGDLYIRGGTLNISAQSPFDYDGQAEYTGGTMIVNGSETTTITNQFGGGMGGGMGGGFDGGGGGAPNGRNNNDMFRG